jgi:cleavage stimulation factor subunit 3
LYAEHELNSGNTKEGVEIFDRCLLNNLNVELWQFYLNYVKSSNDSIENKEEIEKAFEFALDKVGLDINSTPIWLDYLKFIKNQPVSNAFDQSKMMTKLRSLYQRCISNCMNGIDHIWHEYVRNDFSLNSSSRKHLKMKSHLHWQRVYLQNI